MKHADKRDTPIFDRVADLLQDRQELRHGVGGRSEQTIPATMRFFEEFQTRTPMSDYALRNGGAA